MGKTISSAGLLFLYLQGYGKDGRIQFCSVDSNHHMREGFSKAVRGCWKQRTNRGYTYAFVVMGPLERIAGICDRIYKGI